MAQLLVRQLDDEVLEKLQRRAGRNGRGTEEEVRENLRDAIMTEGGKRPPMGSSIAARFRGLGLNEEIPELRGQSVTPAKFEHVG